ncbi:MAG: hypothetical protein WBV72_09225, partial [Nitrososphaeraceae archaeon]
RIEVCDKLSSREQDKSISSDQRLWSTRRVCYHLIPLLHFFYGYPNIDSVSSMLGDYHSSNGPRISIFLLI